MKSKMMMRSFHLKGSLFSIQMLENATQNLMTNCNHCHKGDMRRQHRPWYVTNKQEWNERQYLYSSGYRSFYEDSNFQRQGQ